MVAMIIISQIAGGFVPVLAAHTPSGAINVIDASSFGSMYAPYSRLGVRDLGNRNTEGAGYLVNGGTGHGSLTWTGLHLPSASEVFEIAATGNSAYCFDIFTAAKGRNIQSVANFDISMLNSSYHSVSTAHLVNVAKSAQALTKDNFAGLKDFINANVSDSQLRGQLISALGDTRNVTGASRPFNYMFGRYLIQTLVVYSEVHSWNWSTKKIDTKTFTGGGKDGVPPYQFTSTVENIAYHMNPKALYNFGLARANAGTGEEVGVYKINFTEYGEVKTFTGQAAKDLYELYKDKGTLGHGDIAVSGNGTKLTLKNNHKGGATCYPSQSLSGSPIKAYAGMPYVQGNFDGTGSGQFIVDIEATRSVKADICVPASSAYIQVHKKILQDTNEPLAKVKFGIYTDSAAKNKVAELTTDANGQATNTENTNIIPGNTYYVRELTAAEGQLKGIVPLTTIYSVVLTGAHTSPTTPAKVSAQSISNVLSLFSTKFTKKIVHGTSADLIDDAVFKLRVLDLELDAGAPGMQTGQFIKNGRFDREYVPINGTINLNNLQHGRYELVETSLKNGSRLDLPVNGTSIVFENYQGNFKVISNNSLDNAFAKENANRSVLQGGSISKPTYDASTFWNAEKYGGIRVLKLDKEHQIGLEGVKFRIQGGPDNIDETITTGSDGYATLSPIKLGQYTVTESIPTGYLAPTQITQNVTVTESKSMSDLNDVLFENQREKFSFELNKRDVGDEDPDIAAFDGVTFSVIPISLVAPDPSGTFEVGKPAATMVIKNRVAKIRGGVRLPTGRYRVVETYIPDDVAEYYHLADSYNDLVIESLYENEPARVISNGSVQMAIRTNENVKRIGGLGTGIIENPGANFGLGFANQPYYGLLGLSKVNSETGQPLDGAEFRISSERWNKTKDYVTNNEGFVMSDPIRVGSWRIEETQAPTAHALAKDKVHIVDSLRAANDMDGITNVEFKNDPQTFNLRAIKENYLGQEGRRSLEGAEYELKVIDLVREGISNQKQPGEVVGVYTTDASGNIRVEKLPVGQYELTEVKAPEGYTLNPNPIRITANWDSSGVLIQEEVSYEMAINETAVDEKVAQMRKDLTDVWNELSGKEKTYTDEELNLVKDFSKVAGVGALAQMPIMGRIELFKHIELDDKYEPGIVTPENDIRFEIFNERDVMVDVMTTNEDGKAASKYLPYGTYSVRQVNVTTNDRGEEITYPVENFNVTIDEDLQVHEIVKENMQDEMLFKFVKRDEHTEEIILQSGVEIQVYRAKDDQLVTFDTKDGQIDRLTTGNDGTTVSFTPIRTGDYYFMEVAGPEGYYFDETIKYTFTIPLNENKVPGHVQVVQIDSGYAVYEEITNLPQYGQLTLHKQGEHFTEWSSDQVVVSQQEPSTITNKEVIKPQANVSMLLTSITEKTIEEVVEIERPETEDADEAPAVPEYETITTVIPYESKENITTDASGYFSRKVTKGKYKITDVNGNLLAELVVEGDNSELIEVQLPDVVTNEEVYVEGDEVKVPYTVNKTNYEQGYLADARFELRAAEDINSYDGQTQFYKKGDKLLFATEDIYHNGDVLYAKGDVVSAPIPNFEEGGPVRNAGPDIMDYVTDSITTNSIEAVVATRIPLGKYELVEVEAPLGYKKDNTVRSYEFTPQEHTIKVQLKETEQIINDRQILTIALDKKVLKETEYFGRTGFDYINFGVYTREGILGLPKDSLVGVVQPDANGKMSVSDIPVGSYYFKELSTKNGYVLNNNEFDLTTSYVKDLDEDITEVVEEDVENNPELNEIKVTKVDVTNGEALQGVQFKLWAITEDGARLPVMNGDSYVWITDLNGEITVGNLPNGNYEWEEILTNEGYVEEGTKVSIGVSPDANLEITIGNTPTTLGFHKYDKRDGSALIGAKLALYDKDGNIVQINEDRYVVKSGGNDVMWTTDGEAFVVKGLAIDEEYTLKELQAPAGYVTAKPITFVVANEKGLQFEQIGNDMSRTNISKIDWSSKAPLYGAMLEVIDLETNEVFIDAVSEKPARWVTGPGLEEGFKINGLVVGDTYAIRETYTPEGYLEPLTDVTFVTIDTHDIQSFVVLNEPVPNLKTEAAFINGSKESLPLDSVEVIDTVSYEKLVVGEEYVLTGVLVDSQDPEKVIAEGTTTFVAETTEGTQDVVFTFDASELEGSTLVVFEAIYRDGRLLETHNELQDLDQTIYIPEISTSASNKTSGDNEVIADGEQTIVDRVTYKNLRVGQEYVVNGVLMDKSTSTPLLDVDGNEIKSSTTFVPENTSGSIDLEFTFNASALDGKTGVVFEEVYSNEVLVAIHKDIEDESQTIYFPKIGTTATDKTDGNKVLEVGEETIIVDRVDYENLQVGKTYRIDGTLMVKETGEALLIDGKPVTKSFEFTPESKDGFVELEFTINTEGLEGQTLVVYEKLWNLIEDAEAETTTEVEVAKHEDIEDEAQTVYIPKISTTAEDVDGGKEINPKEKVTIVDVVKYENLVAGQEYTLKGQLIDKETGAVIAENELTFIPEDAQGEIELHFEIDARKYAGKELVVFETVLIDDKVVAIHHDIDDESQTVYITNPEVGTKATVDDAKESPASELMTVKDNVSYSGLVIGRTYTVDGILMDKATGKALLIDGKEVTATLEFVAETTDGEVTLEFTFDGTGLEGRKLVVFEKLFEGAGEFKQLIASHEDIEDEDQTVSILEPLKLEVEVEKSPGGFNTSDASVIGGSLFGIASVIGASALMLKKKKKEDDEQ